MSLREKLSSIGLGDKKSEVYLAVLELGTASVIEIAKKAGVKRPTTYDILLDLCNKRLVTQTFVGKKRKFSAEDPGNLRLIPKEQETQIERILPELSVLFQFSPSKPQLRFYEGIEGIKLVNDDVLTVEEKEYYYFGSAKVMYELLGQEYLEEYVKKRIKKQIWSNALRVRAQEIDTPSLKGGEEHYRRLRFLPKPILEDMVSLYIYDNKVCITSALKECYGLIIESKELVSMMKIMWNIIWEISEPA